MTDTVYTRAEAVERANATHSNIVGTCQLVTRGWLGANSAGDFDGDGASDAEDGWKSEPESARHTDRKPPAGVPVAYLGGANDYGHRALSLGPINGVWYIRSTDAGGSGKVATVPLNWPENAWGLTYAGWSETCDGQPIKEDVKPIPAPQPTPKDTRGTKVDEAIIKLEHAKGPKGSVRARLLERALEVLRKIPKK